MRIWTILLGLAGFFLCGTVCASAMTYYVDYSNGNDLNSGTSKTAPWQHAPGMNGCTGNCASATITAGDHVILKGGVTWGAANFPWHIATSGSSGSPVYYGVDTAWYSGPSWSRPIFNAGGEAISGTNEFVSITASYVTLDNIEMTGFYWSGAPSYGQAQLIFIPNDNDYITIENCYFHSWSHGPNTTNSGYNRAVILLNAGYKYANSIITGNTFDGSPNGTDSMTAIFHGGEKITNNIIQNMSDGIVLTQGGTVSGNTIGPINWDYSGSHENCIEGNRGTYYISNNVVHDCVAEAVVLGPDTNGTGNSTWYVWNNVLYESSAVHSISTVARGFEIYARPTSPSTDVFVYFYNNTIDMGPITNFPCLNIDNQGAGGINTLDYENNFCVSNLNYSLGTGPGATNLTNLNNPLMSSSNAENAGMGQGETPYIDQPTNSTCNGYAQCPVGYGGSSNNLSSKASGDLSSLQNDTAYGNVRATSARPTTGAWDAGAYAYSSSSQTTSTTPPLPPNGLTAVTN